MLESQDDNLKKALQDKFLEYEATVPGTSEDFILNNIQSSGSNQWLQKGFVYGIILLLSLGAYIVFQPRVKNDSENETTARITETESKQQESPQIESKERKSADRIVKSPEETIARNNVSARQKRSMADNIHSEESKLTNSSLVEEVSNSIVVENMALVNRDTKKLDTLVAKQIEKSTSLSDSIPEPIEPEINKIRLNLSVMPFLGYNVIKPNGGDGVSLSGFQTPSSLSSQRLGFKAAIAVDYELKKNKYVFAGISYFRYQTQFTYQSNEANDQVNTTNSVNETVQGISFLVGGRYPLKISEKRKQFVSAGIDAQWLIGNYNLQTSRNQFMVNIGYANDFSIGKGHILRLQPTFNYSLTKFHYGGLVTQPYWLGLEIGYSLGLK